MKYINEFIDDFVNEQVNKAISDLSMSVQGAVMDGAWKIHNEHGHAGGFDMCNETICIAVMSVLDRVAVQCWFFIHRTRALLRMKNCL